MGKNELEVRTMRFACDVVDLVSLMKRDVMRDVVGRQVLKSGTSIGANYREANRAESRDDFKHKISLSEKEASETVYWLEICLAKGLVAKERVATALKEASELLAIFCAIGRKLRKN